ncbi:hypothetical protein CCY99_01905 [Helicobacter sp. 16-1353]|uniref:FkbM family methyltransferase n=1 Tax=Helicobacter sp. 16-1353 TaxID=2004996 RepID=UPI000DCEB260|nr:FkbM family methyltransferase [Helicobacter sp. 16-1353]RAX54921.1 hypothetical protein CCY99_01905 [Helicobacter sp. 16-1353]
MANMGYKVLQYDASIDSAPYNHPNITFIKKFVGVVESDDTISFERVVRENGLDKSHHNIMQIDIEGAEWDILREVDLGFVAQYFPQIVFEFQGCNPEYPLKLKKRLPALEKLRRYYTPIHTHFNNNGSIFYGKGLFLSNLIEVSYVRNDLVAGLVSDLDSNNLAESNCVYLDFADFRADSADSAKSAKNPANPKNTENLNKIPFKKGLGYLAGLDSPNIKNYPEIPIIFH